MNRLFTALSTLLLMTCAVGAYGQAHLGFSLAADPLPLNGQETLFLYRDGQQMKSERWNWQTAKSENFTLALPVRDGQQKLQPYTMAFNASGYWYVNVNSVLLRRPDGKSMRLDLLADLPNRGMNAYEEGEQPVAVGLDDGSLLLLLKRRGDSHGQAFRVSLEGAFSPGLKLRTLATAPKFNYGIGAVKLGDGRVLMAGGYGTPNQAWLYDPQKDAWSATGSMRAARMSMGFAALPDGRAFVAGSSWITTSSDDNNVRLGAVYGAELWDPRSGQWTALPSLPLSFRINAYGASGPTAAVLPDGSLVVGGAMHRHVLLLRTQGKGFAPYWRVVGSPKEQRVGGVVQALGKNEVIVLGGWMKTPSDQCCWRRSGGERVAWLHNGEQRADSVGLVRADAAIAHRGSLSLVAGGWEAFQLSTAATQASAVVELMDRQSRRVSVLPPLPHPLLTGKAEWVDDDRVLVKAVSHPPLYEQSFRGMDGRSLEAESSGFLGIFSLHQNAWRSVSDPRLASAELAGVSKGEAILVAPDASVWSVALSNLSVQELPRLVLTRNEGAFRVTSDGRIVVAGGQAQTHTLQAMDADCDRADCPTRLFGYGGLEPSRRHEIYIPAQRQWQLSAPSKGSGESAVVRSDGRVVSLGLVPTSTPQKSWMIEESTSDGSKWRTLPLPAFVADPSDNTFCGDDHSARRCKLLLGDHPGVPGGIVVFLRSRWVTTELYDLWVYADDTKSWEAVAQDLRVEQLRTERILLRRIAGKTIYGTAFQTRSVGIFVE